MAHQNIHFAMFRGVLEAGAVVRSFAIFSTVMPLCCVRMTVRLTSFLMMSWTEIQTFWTSVWKITRWRPGAVTSQPFCAACAWIALILHCRRGRLLTLATVDRCVRLVFCCNKYGKRLLLPRQVFVFMEIHGNHQEIKKVGSWMRHNKLSLNYSKTVYMIFNTDKKQSSPFRVQIGSHLINRRVNSTKYLGMHLDNKLNWDTRISKLESKLSCYSGILYRIREYLSTNELKMIYFSLVYSHLQYAIGAWGSATKLVYTD